MQLKDITVNFRLKLIIYIIALSMIAEYPLIPRQAFLFFPKEEEIYQIKNKKTYRFIFEGEVPFTGFQKEKLAELHDEIRREAKNCHLSFLPEATLLRFLQATKFDVEDCVKELKKYKKWEDSILPLRLKPEIEDLLKKGLFYMVGRDINFRPIIVVNVARIIELDLKEKTFCEVAGYFFTYILENCMIEGQIQTWITIVDLGNIGMFSLGGTIIDIISFLSRNFRCRLHKSYLINCPGSIKFLFGMVKKAMTEDQINKIHLQEESELPGQAFTNLFQATIQKKYGGFHDDYTEFWPPVTAHQEISPYQRGRLISVHQYGEMHANGMLKKKKISASLLEEYHCLMKEEAHKKEMSKVCEMDKHDLLVTESSPNAFKLREQDYLEDSPPVYASIPMPIDFGDLFQ